MQVQKMPSVCIIKTNRCHRAAQRMHSVKVAIGEYEKFSSKPVSLNVVDT